MQPIAPRGMSNVATAIHYSHTIIERHFSGIKEVEEIHGYTVCSDII